MGRRLRRGGRPRGSPPPPPCGRGSEGRRLGARGGPWRGAGAPHCAGPVSAGYPRCRARVGGRGGGPALLRGRARRSPAFTTPLLPPFLSPPRAWACAGVRGPAAARQPAGMQARRDFCEGARRGLKTGAPPPPLWRRRRRGWNAFPPPFHPFPSLLARRRRTRRRTRRGERMRRLQAASPTGRGGEAALWGPQGGPSAWQNPPLPPPRFPPPSTGLKVCTSEDGRSAASPRQRGGPGMQGGPPTAPGRGGVVRRRGSGTQVRGGPIPPPGRSTTKRSLPGAGRRRGRGGARSRRSSSVGGTPPPGGGARRRARVPTPCS